ncbi:hypothetical protein RJ640_006977 [Escallonia rubra]|uniref:Reverse transcriptase Ty1/copia-type domain-containing protein n=1 Tax=Escallonia rubra TaxID=112253 RepID=A0AA88RFB6_9ASTE|nr:hypothetical protein RJ640_006977 [Escallonia rubra]
MAKEFEMTDIGLMSYYLGIEVKERDDGIFISQEVYGKEVLKKFNMENFNTISIPIEIEKKLPRLIKGGSVDITLFKSLVGSLSIAKKEVQVKFVKSEDQVADTFTKPLEKEVFEKLRIRHGM